MGDFDDHEQELLRALQADDSPTMSDAARIRERVMMGAGVAVGAGTVVATEVAAASTTTAGSAATGGSAAANPKMPRVCGLNGPFPAARPCPICFNESILGAK